MHFKNFGDSPPEIRDVKMADFGARAKFGSSWKFCKMDTGFKST
jgi:hypothetical protein